MEYDKKYTLKELGLNQEVKNVKKNKKQNKKIGEYPCVDYLHNALRLIKR